MKPGSKYFPLYEYLRLSEKDPLVLTLKEMEILLGRPLSQSAWKSSAFWSNRTSGALQAKAWMDAGYQVVDVDFQKGTVTFGKPSIHYEVRREGDTILWTGSMVRALRVYLGFSQVELSEMLGVRQQTISEWENQIYMPTRSRSKHLHMVAEKAGFDFGGADQPLKEPPTS
ncbi:MAG: hypothetical protein A2Z14_00950 [Chloroflexi bacterium RBG_16_48_8]|nr:MAG: hypothetical protein A2Z14_00950 [Chloroflexi bacterium RBG_16_48_8]